MSGNFYSEINLHFVWHTKNSLPLLRPEIEPVAHRLLKKRIIDTPGVYVHAIGGTPTHVHLALTIPPTLTISEYVGQLKGGSSYDVNREVGGKKKSLQWQTGYGVVSFGTGDLPWVCKYIERQKEHHARGRAVDRLERTEQMETYPAP
jgi:putative transposase